MQIGDKVYFDSFAGLIRCVVTEVSGPDEHNLIDVTLRVTATGKNKYGYKFGEKIVTSPNWAIERNRVYVRSGQYRIRPRIQETV